MKKRIISLLLLLLMISSMFLLSSCVLFTESSLLGDSDGGDSSSGGTNVTVEAGDNYNVTINSSAEPNTVAAAKSVLSAVSVYCEFERNKYSWSGNLVGTETAMTTGSGVIYKLDKNTGSAYIITNYHVVYDAYCNTENQISSDINIYLYGQEATKYAIPAKYVGGSMNYDLAVLKVEGSTVLAESHAMEAAVADSDEISLLETAIAVGNPEGIGLSATVGYINVDSEYINISMVLDGYSRDIELRCIRIDAAVNSGNSGGGLFNAKGELIGIVNAKLSDSSVDNIGYAIPSNVAKAVADNIIYYCDGTSKESVYRCLLGVSVGATESSAEYDAESGKIFKKERVVISDISDTGAAKGVLEVNDVINSITIDGVKHDVTRMFHVVDSMLNARVGSTVVINVTRNGETKDVTVNITSEMLTAY